MGRGLEVVERANMEEIAGVGPFRESYAPIVFVHVFHNKGKSLLLCNT